jgi:RING finger protein 113A
MFKKREKKTKIMSLEHGENADIDEISDKNVIQQDINLHKDRLLGKKRADFSTIDSNGDGEIVKDLMDDLKYKSSLTLQNTNYATKEVEIDTEKDKDARAIIDRNMKISKDKLQGKIANDVYMGKSASIIYAEKSEKDMSMYKITGTLGPLRAPSNLRVTCRFDFAPGICKDWKETGFCGFGDGCIFMHDRGDYKSGWEVEEEWKTKQKEKEDNLRKGKKTEEDSDNSENGLENDSCDISLQCQRCDNDFVSPISTICGHYFCEKCALNHYSKSSTCYVCKKPTQGIFNNAEKIITRITLIKKKNHKKKHGSHTHPHNRDDATVITNLHEDEDNLNFLNDRERDYKQFDKDEEDYGFGIKKNGKNLKKKNKFKLQNDWICPSDYKSYD